MSENRALLAAAEMLALASVRVRELEAEIVRLHGHVARWETTGAQMAAMIEALTASVNQATALLRLHYDHLCASGLKDDFDAWIARQAEIARAQMKTEVC